MYGYISPSHAKVAELVDAPDLESGTSVWGFKSPPLHHEMHQVRP